MCRAEYIYKCLLCDKITSYQIEFKEKDKEFVELLFDNRLVDIFISHRSIVNSEFFREHKCPENQRGVIHLIGMRFLEGEENV